MSCILDLFHKFDESQERLLVCHLIKNQKLASRVKGKMRMPTAFLSEFADADLDNLNSSCQKYPHVLKLIASLPLTSNIFKPFSPKLDTSKNPKQRTTVPK